MFKDKKRSLALKFKDYITGENLIDVYVTKFWKDAHNLVDLNNAEALRKGVSAADDLIQRFGGTKKDE